MPFERPLSFAHLQLRAAESRGDLFNLFFNLGICNVQLLVGLVISRNDFNVVLVAHLLALEVVQFPEQLCALLGALPDFFV